MCLVIGFAVLPLRAHLYEPFLALHIALVILTLVGCWYHLVPHFGYDYGYQVWLYISFAYWAFERTYRVARVAYYNHLGRSKALIEAIPGCDIMQITIYPRTTSGFGPGQHSFLYFPSLGKFWDSHPFSVAGWGSQTTLTSAPGFPTVIDQGNEKEAHESMSRATPVHGYSGHEPASIRFLVRPHSGITSTIRRRLSSSSSGSMELSAYCEGPYAGHRATLYPLYYADTILCIVGGIGITHILGIIQEYASPAVSSHSGGNAKTIQARRLILAWTARELGLIEHVRRNMLPNVAGIECLFFCTESVDGDQKLGSTEETTAMTAGRMDIANVVSGAVEVGRRTVVVVCAPGNMADEVTRQTVKSVKDGFKIDLVEETFAW